MKRLTKEITRIVLLEYGSEELLKRLSDPFWFQALSCVIGYDWHSSGTTTTTCGALKLALNSITDSDERIYVAGGKGKTSKKTPTELKSLDSHLKGDFSNDNINSYIKASRLTAKVDNSCVQDDFQLYHHVFLVNQHGSFGVIQQGMNDQSARRYHWISEGLHTYSETPRETIASNHKKSDVLDLTAHQSVDSRKVILDLISDNPVHLKRDLQTLLAHNQKQKPLISYFSDTSTTKIPELKLPTRHGIHKRDISEKAMQVLQQAYEIQPKTFDDLLTVRNLGARKLRALTLVADIIYGNKASWEDPVKYSFAHGGKDGIPFPVDRTVYASTIQTLQHAIDQAKLHGKEQANMFSQLKKFASRIEQIYN